MKKSKAFSYFALSAIVGSSWVAYNFPASQTKETETVYYQQEQRHESDLPPVKGSPGSTPSDRNEKKNPLDNPVVNGLFMPLALYAGKKGIDRAFSGKKDLPEDD